jgi:hypothetical protein
MDHTKDEVIKLVSPYLGQIAECIQSGHDCYFKGTPKSELVDHSPTTKANLIYDKIVRKIKDTFGQTPGINLVYQKRMFVMIIANKVLIKFKKFKQGLRVGNVITKQFLKFQSQQQIEMFPRGVNLYAGYLPDPFGRKIDKIWLACPSYNGNHWALQLNEDEYTKSIIELPLETPKSTIKRVRAKLKSEGVKDGTTDNQS